MRIMDELIEEAICNNFSQTSLDNLSAIATVDVRSIDNYTKQYTFFEKANRATDNGEGVQLKTVAITTRSILNHGNTEYNGSVKLKAEMYFKSTSVNNQTVYKLLYGTGKVIENDEQYGKDLYIKVRSQGSYTTLSGTRGSKTQGWYSAYKSNPAIGTTYYNNHTFEEKYYYCDENLAMLSLDVTYQFSHNGTTYYTITSSVRYGSLG